MFLKTISTLKFKSIVFHKPQMKKIKFDFSFILAVVMQLVLIANMVGTLVRGECKISSFVIMTLIAMIGWGLCEYNRQKDENNKKK